VRNPDKLIFCTDIGYPPMEFFDQGAAVGADIEIGRELARRLGLEAMFVDQAVAGIVDALYAGRCHLIINAFTDNPSRRERLDFVHYLSVGQTVLLPSWTGLRVGEPRDLAGRRVAVQGDTSNEASLAELDAANHGAGLSPIWIAAFRGTTAEATAGAVSAVRSGEADAYFVDAVSAIWTSRQYPELQMADLLVNVEPYGVAVKKGDAVLRERIQEAIAAMYRDGSIDEILARWDLLPLALAR
jgi:polar amino acid transport system substrate-binding protein